MVINLIIILYPIDSLIQFLFHLHLNLLLIQDENQEIVIKLENDAFDVKVRNHLSIPSELMNIINRMDRRV